MKSVCIIGDGAWGTAVATVLATNQVPVKLWCYDPAVAHSISTIGINERYLPGIKLSPRITPTSSLEWALADSTWVFVALPVIYIRSVLLQAILYTHNNHDNQRWAILSKGIENNTLLCAGDLVASLIPQISPPVIVSGPSYAHEVACGQLTAVTLACSVIKNAQDLACLLATPYFLTTCSSDSTGVQVTGAVKNVIALGMGMLDGAGYQDNTKALMFVQAIREIKELIKIMGGDQATFDGLSGIGDLVLTAYGKSSRNRKAGQLIGQGMSIDDLKDTLHSLPESINTVRSLTQLAQKYKITLPVCMSIYDVVYNNRPISYFICRVRNSLT